MDINKLIKKGEVVVEPTVDKCLINKREVIVDNKPKTLEKGPCNKINEGKCLLYISPAAKWRNGNCAAATHIIQVEDERKFKNPLKESKRSNK